MFRTTRGTLGIVQRRDGLGQGSHGEELERLNDSGLGTIGMGEKHRAKPVLTGGGSDRQHAASRLNAAIERQLA